MNPQIFREYDIRGVVDKDLTEDVARQIGQAFGTYVQAVGKKNLVVGRDNRLSSERFANAVIDGLLSTGCNVVDVGLLPTPVFYYSIVHLQKDGGIMITGSHNPPDFNGFKVCEGYASIYGEKIQRLKRIIQSGRFAKGKGKLDRAETVDSYCSYLKSRIDIKREVKVVLDAGNGTTGAVAPDLIEAIGCRVKRLYCDLDGNFPNHFPDPTIPEYLKDLTQVVRGEKAELGVAYDGDGDRIGVVDDKGRIVWGDRLLILFSRQILKQKKGAKIIFDVKCSQALMEDVKKHGGVPIMWKTGHSLIKEKLRQEGALLAGEMSGHMFFADRYYGYDDAIYASCRLLEILSQSNRALSELLKDVPLYFATPEIRVPCPDEEKFKVVEQVKRYFQSRYNTIDVDGVRILFDDGWGLIRASNTQPILVLRFEARTEQGLEEIRETITGKLREFSSVSL
ncbi:MAG: phosphomannomutase/phosphoglucomutase [Candidatus Latescibacteria bacterium]|nr:phosphomannomutase/phosphoglucomutase [Candidatus Latescibacterota bacterium]